MSLLQRRLKPNLEKKGLSYDSNRYKDLLQLIISKKIFIESEQMLRIELSDEDLSEMVQNVYKHRRAEYFQKILDFYVEYRKEITHDCSGKVHDKCIDDVKK